MRYLLTIFLFAVSFLSFSQTEEKEAVMKVVTNVFEAMRSSDSTLLKACFVENPNTFTVFRTKQGETKFLTDKFQKWVDAVGTPKEDIWNEPIWNEKVEIDGDLASVWVDYAFYLNDQFSHCGVDAFHLVRLEGDWKIFHLVDTRRRSSCEIPDEVKP